MISRKLTVMAAGGVGEASMFGVLDFLVLGGVAGLAVYWFVLRKKKPEEPTTFRNLTIRPPERSTSMDTSFINKMKTHGRNVVVFYGSQTGTAEEFAGRLAKDCVKYGMKGMVADPEEYDMEELSKLTEIENSLAIFCMATYGEGDPTDNAQEFKDWLEEGSEALDGINFAVFSLGNKTYEHYNAMGIYVDKRLEELGACRTFEIGLGDDDANIEEDFVTWREKFWPTVCEKFNIDPSKIQDINMRQYSLTEHEELPCEKMYGGEPARLGSFRNQKPPYDAKNPYLSPIKVNRELHKGGDRSCMHIEFDITGSKIRYEAGDHIAVYPVNDSELVDRLAKCLDLDLGKIFTLTNVDDDASKKHPFPCPTTYRTALLHYLDITSCPRTNVLKELSEYAEGGDKDQLVKMSSPTPEGKELYNTWIIADHRTIVEVLEDLPSAKPPLDHLCELLPRLQARYYSISSSPKMHPTSIHITAILTEWTKKTGRLQKGVATSWLKLKVPAGEERPRVPVFVRKSQFRLPFKPSVPVLMIGPGTGLAPFRGFIQDRNVQKTEGKPVGDALLFFGCRKKAEDFIYEDELNNYINDGTISKLFVAFSRDQDKKVYVQNLIDEQGDEVWKILDGGGHIYVCGDARHMAHDVDQTLQKIVSDKGAMDSEAAHVYLKRLRSRGRYSCDVWS